MNDASKKRLEELLRQAGEMTGPTTPSDANLAQCVRGLHRRKKRRRRIATATATAAAIVAVVFLSIADLGDRTGADVKSGLEQRPQLAHKSAATEQMSAEQLQAEVARLHAEIKELRALIEQSRRLEEQRHRLANLRRNRPLDLDIFVQSEMEKTAYRMVEGAARDERRGGSHDESLATYRRAIELFPDTSSAKVAQQRIDDRLNNRP